MDYNFCQLNQACIHGSIPLAESILNNGVYPNKTDMKDVSPTTQIYQSPCCKDCLCNRNCWRPERCCFPEVAHKEVDYSFETCTYAQAPVPSVEERNKVIAFYMVDKNPRSGCVDNTFSTQHPGMECGEVEAADWGSINPVSSRTHRKIYKNIHCAVCHGVTDAKLWKASSNCIESGNLGIFANTNLTEAVLHEQCTIQFDYDDFFYAQDRRCFRGEIVDTCPSLHFFMPEEFDISTTMAALYCQSSFFSPYVHEVVYANVFCLLCNNNFSIPCDPGGFNPNSFTAVLVPQTSVRVYQRERHKLACPEPQYTCFRKQCRPVLCQSGTLLISGKCRYVTDVIFNSDFIVNVVLLPTSGLETPELPDVPFNKGQSPWSWSFNRAWGEEWKIKNVFFSENPSFMVESILLSLLYIVDENAGIQTHVLFDQIKNHVNKVTQWKLNTSNGNVYLDQMNYLGPETISQEDKNWVMAMVGEGDVKSKLNATKTHEVIVSMNYTSVSTTMSRMFFCEQIELYQNEFEMYVDKVAYINHRDALLFEGQFITVVEHGVAKIRICLNESGFNVRIPSSGVQAARMMPEIMGITVWYACLCLFTAL